MSCFIDFRWISHEIHMKSAQFHVKFFGFHDERPLAKNGNAYVLIIYRNIVVK